MKTQKKDCPAVCNLKEDWTCLPLTQDPRSDSKRQLVDLFFELQHKLRKTLSCNCPADQYEPDLPCTLLLASVGVSPNPQVVPPRSWILGWCYSVTLLSPNCKKWDLETFSNFLPRELTETGTAVEAVASVVGFTLPR